MHIFFNCFLILIYFKIKLIFFYNKYDFLAE